MMRSYILSLALLFIAFTDLSIAQKEAEVRALEGEPLTVECSLRVEQRAEWRVDGAAPAPDMRAAGELPLGAGRLLARLHSAAARLQHAGLYSCHRDAAAVRVLVLPQPAHAAGEVAGAAPVQTPEAAAVPADGDEPRTLVMFELYRQLQFDCTLPDPSAGVSEFVWSKNDSAVVVGEPKGPVLEKGGAVLTFARAHEDDFGNYTCRVGGGVVRAWQAHAKPIARVPANTNVVEGQKFSITCKLLGKPHPRVSWTYAPAEGENATDIDTSAPDSRYSVRDSAAGVPSGVLEVADALRSDAGVYSCVPPLGLAASSTLRVKDVYAALWPFLGICLEVFILCAIILVYEKRRTKPELDDSDADAHDQ